MASMLSAERRAVRHPSPLRARHAHVYPVVESCMRHPSIGGLYGHVNEAGAWRCTDEASPAAPVPAPPPSRRARVAPRTRRSPLEGKSAAATCRCRAPCRQRPTASASRMNGPSSGASHAGHGAGEHTLPHVIDLLAVRALATWSQATTESSGPTPRPQDPRGETPRHRVPVAPIHPKDRGGVSR
jgi:hypothetical protein